MQCFNFLAALRWA